METTPTGLSAPSHTAAVLMLRGKQARGSLVETSRRRLTLGLVGGSGLGFIAGLIGRGGGSFVVPLLYMAGIEAKAAAATSSLVVTFSGVSSFTSHVLMEASPVWHVWAMSAAAVLVGSQLGSRFMAAKLDPTHVKKVFGVVLLFISASLILKDVLGIL